jgi:hypothetical protein
MLAGSVYELPRPALPTVATGSGACAGEPWTTPQAHDAHPGRAQRLGRHGTLHGGRDLCDEVALWPTPVAQDSHGHAQTRENPTPGQTGGTTLAGAVQDWPTPTASDAKASGAQGYSTESGRHPGTTLTDAAVRFPEWPTPTAQTYGSNRGGSAGRTGPVRPSLEAAAREWPTPTATDNGSPTRFSDGEKLSGAACWPTPTASDSSGGACPAEKVPESREGAQPLKEVLGSLLSPAWVSALQAWPLGLTDLTK